MFLPEGKHFLYLAGNVSGQTDPCAIFVGKLDSSEKKFLTKATGNAAYAAPGYLLPAEDALRARFDASKLALSGEAVPLLEMAALFRDVDCAVENTVDLSSRLQFELVDLGYESRAGRRNDGGLDMPMARLRIQYCAEKLRAWGSSIFTQTVSCSRSAVKAHGSSQLSCRDSIAFGYSLKALSTSAT
jgi:hypothetical protein